MKKKHVTNVLVLLIGAGLVLAAMLRLDFLSEGDEQSQPDSGAVALDNAVQTQVKGSSSPQTGATKSSADMVENDNADQIVLGVSLFNIDSHFETVGYGMEAAAEEEGVEILFGSANTDEAEQDRILEKYIDQQVDIILLSPVDKINTSASLKTARKNGIQIVCFNSCFQEEVAQEIGVSATFRTDRTQLGANTAAIVADWMDSQSLDTLHVGSVGCTDACKPRVQGFFDNLDALDIDWELVDGQRGFNEASEAIGAAETLIQKHPEINIVFTENEGTTIGTVQAVKRQGRAGEVFVFGTDISPQIAEMLLADDNILQAVTAQSPYQIGYLAVKAAVELVEGGEKQDITYVPVESFRRDQPEKVREYLAK